MTNKYCHYTREYIITTNISFIHETVYCHYTSSRMMTIFTVHYIRIYVIHKSVFYYTRRCIRRIFVVIIQEYV